jgi:hypothetical protein
MMLSGFVVSACLRGPRQLPLVGVMRLHPVMRTFLWPAARFEEAIRPGEYGMLD